MLQRGELQPSATKYQEIHILFKLLFLHHFHNLLFFVEILTGRF